MKSITHLVILLLILTLCPKGYAAEGDRKNMVLMGVENGIESIFFQVK